MIFYMNFTGTYFVARTLFERVSAKLMAQKRIEAVVAEPLAIEELRARLAYTTYEQGMIVREMMDRSNRPPFSVQTDRAQRVLVYRERDARAAALLNAPGSTAALSAVYAQAIAKRPGDWVLERNYGMFLTARGEYAQAVVHLQKSLAMIEDQADALCALGQAFSALGNARQAEEAFASVRALEPRYPGLPAVK
jgi:tetratricopeptide (TPR) repeat protein